MLFKKKNKEKIFFENDNHIVSHFPSYYLNRVRDFRCILVLGTSDRGRAELWYLLSLFFYVFLIKNGNSKQAHSVTYTPLKKTSDLVLPVRALTSISCH